VVAEERSVEVRVGAAERHGRAPYMPRLEDRLT
jgi:hypothetical protein